MSAYTPGPWLKSPTPENDALMIHTGAGGPTIATTSRNTPEDRANAHIIKAALELLEALREYVAALDDPRAAATDASAIRDRARAAIAKAEGREGGR